jgi:osmotically-inducible protein OsmY
MVKSSFTAIQSSKFFFMRTDAQIQKDVMAQLQWEPFLNAAQIGVAVRDGVVTLSGHVDSYSKKAAAEAAAKKILGVKAVAEGITVGVSPFYKRTDTEIAEAVLSALKWNTAVQEEKIKVKVEDGVVSLDGTVDWLYQRQNAFDAVRNLAGVVLVNNNIVVAASPTPKDIKDRIKEALRRNATLDADKITVSLDGSEVVLKGTVRSLAEKEDAERAAWSGRGVREVVNDLEVAVPEFVY